MNNGKAIEKSNREDLAFGAQLLGDYARFICNTLCYRAKDHIDNGTEFSRIFDDIYAKAVQPMTSAELAALNKAAYETVQDFRKFVLEVLRHQIMHEVIIQIDPQYLNMMANTTELLLDGLSAYMRGEYPETSTLATIWLENMYITARMIENRVGSLYFKQKLKAGEFADTFLKLHNKSLTIDGLRRTGLKSFPVMDEFFSEIQGAMVGYAEFLVELLELISEKKYTGMLTVLDVDSIYRRACFFATKLSQISAIPAPVCNPSEGRRE